MLCKFTTDAIQLLFFSYFCRKIYKKNWMLICVLDKKEKIDMRKLLCPQCKIAGLYVKNEKKERLLVYVSDEGEVVPEKILEENMEGFDLTIVYCLGCSWSGSPKKAGEEVGMKGKLKISFIGDFRRVR